MTFLIIIFFTLWMACFAQLGREEFAQHNRLAWLVGGLVLIEAAAIPNPFLGICVAVIPLSIWYRWPKPSDGLEPYLFPTGLFVGAYLAAIHTLTAKDVPMLLWMLVVMGCVIGSWALYSFRYSWWERTPFDPKHPEHVDGEFIGHGYRHCHRVPLIGWKLWLWEGTLRPECGQLNPIHTQCLSALSVAATVGLWWSGVSFWILLLILWQIAPIALIQWHDRYRWHPTQGILHLASIGLAFLPLLYGWKGLLGAFLCVCVAFPLLLPFNNYRMHVWTEMLKWAWWDQPWSVRLLGASAGSWVYLHQDLKYREEFHAWQTKQQAPIKDLFSSAHNDFVQQLVEHGAIGGLALLLYVSASLWALASGSKFMGGVYLVGVVSASVMFLHFPTDFYHRVEYQNARATTDGTLVAVTTLKQEHGSPALLIVYWLIAVMAEITM